MAAKDSGSTDISISLSPWRPTPAYEGKQTQSHFVSWIQLEALMIQDVIPPLKVVSCQLPRKKMRWWYARVVRFSWHSLWNKTQPDPKADPLVSRKIKKKTILITWFRSHQRTTTHMCCIPLNQSMRIALLYLELMSSYLGARLETALVASVELHHAPQKNKKMNSEWHLITLYRLDLIPRRFSYNKELSGVFDLE